MFGIFSLSLLMVVFDPLVSLFPFFWVNLEVGWTLTLHGNPWRLASLKQWNRSACLTMLLISVRLQGNPVTCSESIYQLMTHYTPGAIYRKDCAVGRSPGGFGELSPIETRCLVPDPPRTNAGENMDPFHCWLDLAEMMSFKFLTYKKSSRKVSLALVSYMMTWVSNP